VPATTPLSSPSAHAGGRNRARRARPDLNYGITLTVQLIVIAIHRRRESGLRRKPPIPRTAHLFLARPFVAHGLHLDNHGRGAPDEGVFSLAVPSQGCQCRRAHSCSHSSLGEGNPGDTRSVGKGVMEMRIAYGSGYRVYYLLRGAQIVILLCGGDKRTQRQDIEQAQILAETL
jgi:putative addiction module killer protein